MRFIIPSLRKIADAARKHVSDDLELQVAFDELALAEEESAERHRQAMIQRGQNCVECDKRFIPLPDDPHGVFCSIGCRFSVRKSRE